MANEFIQMIVCSSNEKLDLSLVTNLILLYFDDELSPRVLVVSKRVNITEHSLIDQFLYLEALLNLVGQIFANAVQSIINIVMGN